MKHPFDGYELTPWDTQIGMKPISELTHGELITLVCSLRDRVSRLEILYNEVIKNGKK